MQEQSGSSSASLGTARNQRSDTLDQVHLIEIIRQPDERQVAELTGFVETVATSVGERPLSDHLWLDLRSGAAPGFIAVRIADERATVALAQISAANSGGSLEVVAAPWLDPTTTRRVHDDAVHTVVEAFRTDGGGPLTWWFDDARLLPFAADLGLEPVRALHEMRRPLPTEQHATVETRSFRPGHDDAEWLRVNNAAFAAHGEQGGWTAETLALRLQEPWFDPEGFRIHERDGRIAAFCWTKLHHELDPVIGEIYVIAADPELHGAGLGKQLTLAGLDSITARGVATANLYVDADNTSAVGLYDRLGFTIHRTRHACAGDLPPLETP